MEFWQHLPEKINPIFLKLGSLEIRYYGVMYVMSFVVAYALLWWRVKNRESSYKWEQVDYFFTMGILGVVLGGRLGYVFLYNLQYFLQHPLEILLPFSFEGGFHFTGIGGMSYHGGLIGAFLAGVLFCRKEKINIWKWADFIIPTIPLGYMLGRIGNFLNNELYGRVTEKSWGMYFPYAETYELRHPSQLYEAFGEGLLLFLILWPLRNNKKWAGQLLGLYITGYAVVRFIIEFYRQPDAHIGFVWFDLSIGQIYCAVMALAGIVVSVIGRRSIRVKA